MGSPPPPRRTEYTLVVTTSVATAAAYTAAAPVSSSQPVVLIVFRIHAHTVRPRLPIRAVAHWHLLFSNNLDCPRFGRRRSCAHRGRKGARTLIGRHRYRLYQPAAFRHGTHDVGGSPCAERRGNGACFLRMRQSVVTLLHQRPSTAGRPGRSPAQCSAQRDRGAIGAAAAARLLQPLILAPAPKIVTRHLCCNRTTITEA